MTLYRIFLINNLVITTTHVPYAIYTVITSIHFFVTYFMSNVRRWILCNETSDVMDQTFQKLRCYEGAREHHMELKPFQRCFGAPLGG